MLGCFMKSKGMARYAAWIAFGGISVLCTILNLAGIGFGYIGIGIIGIAMGAFGYYNFNVLLQLIEQVDKYASLNKQFKAENAQIEAQVNKLGKAREELGGVSDSLARANEKLKDNVTKFRALEENLSKLGESNIEGLAQLQDQSAKMMEQWQMSLIKHEKDILEAVYDQFGMMDGDADMDREEFAQMTAALPQVYRTRLDSHAAKVEEFFADDGKIDFDEFSKLMDSFAEEEADSKQ